MMQTSGIPDFKSGSINWFDIYRQEQRKLAIEGDGLNLGMIFLGLTAVGVFVIIIFGG